MPRKAPLVLLTPPVHALLQKLIRAQKTPQNIAERARIVCMSFEGLSNLEQASRLGVDNQRIGRWRSRWVAQQADLDLCCSNDDLTMKIVDILSDNSRSGRPPEITAEQIALILAIACESPEKSGIPIRTWTNGELARESIKRNVVSTISPRHVGRFLKSGRYKTT